jgi:hypothetical protein
MAEDKNKEPHPAFGGAGKTVELRRNIIALTIFIVLALSS